MKDVKKSLNRLWWNSILTSLIFIIVGILLIIKPEEIITIISMIVGIGIIIIGIFAFIKYLKYKTLNGYGFDLVYGIICIIAGTLLVLNPKAVASVLPLILGVWMLINGIFKIQYVLELRNYDRKFWIWSIILTILTLGCGILFIFNPFKGAKIITQILGGTIVAYAIMDIVNSYLLKKYIRTFVEVAKEINVIEEK